MKRVLELYTFNYLIVEDGKDDSPVAGFDNLDDAEDYVGYLRTLGDVRKLQINSYFWLR